MAVKFLPADAVRSPTAQARFEREIEAVGRLDHPNIVRAYDAGQENGSYYLVMELVDGADLAEIVRRSGPLGVADSCEIIRQAALGLAHASEHHLVHRDVKPSNLLLSRDGTVKVSDLGLAMLRRTDEQGNEESALTGRGQIVGTADYMAPEQALDTRSADSRADIYSLGCTLFALLTGSPPYAGPENDTALKKILAHRTLPAPSIHDSRPDAPRQLDALLRQMMAKEPEERTTDFREIARSLEPFAAGHDLNDLLVRFEAHSPRRLAQSDTRPPRSTAADAEGASPAVPRVFWKRRKLSWSLAPLLAAAILATWAWFGWPDSTPPPDDRWAPGVKYDLLKREPKKLVWPELATAFISHDKERSALAVNAPHVALVQLGNCTEESFTLSVKITQDLWTGNFGVFLGCREIDPISLSPRAEKAWQFVGIALRPDLSDGKLSKGTALLYFELGMVELDRSGNYGLSNRGEAPAVQVQLPKGSTAMLEVAVKHGRLTSVLWGGDEISLANRIACEGFRATESKAPSDLYRGGFGFYNFKCDCLFRDASLVVSPQ
ncbi:MAG: serine/threonine protein kinase [Planctomycetia bacterium]|nr:serine/threonine protein kinase [Planctomycetia bacterium]